MGYMEMSNRRYGDLVKQLVEKKIIKKGKLITRLHITEEQLDLIMKGECEEKEMYKACFSFTIIRLVPRKFKLKQIPDGLPKRDEIEAMMAGIHPDLNNYYSLIYALNKIPNKRGKVKIVSNTSPVRGKRNETNSRKRRSSYGVESQITRKAWGSAYKPARG